MSAQSHPVGTVVTMLLLSVAAFSLYAYEQHAKPAWHTASVSSVDRNVRPDAWNTYTNDRFAVTLQYPSHWHVSTTTTATGGLVPLITVYPRELQGDDPPPYYIVDNVTHVSLYPHGVPTERLRAPRADTSVAPGDDFNRIRALLKATSSPFAFEAAATSYPQSWQPWGFAFARVKLDGMAIYCVSGADAVRGDCTPYPENHNIHRSGALDIHVRRTAVRILQSVRFTTSTRPVAGAALEG